MNELQLVQNKCMEAALQFPRKTSTTFIYSSRIQAFFALRTNNDVYGNREFYNMMYNIIDERSSVSNGSTTPLYNTAIEYNTLPKDVRLCLIPSIFSVCNNYLIIDLDVILGT